MHTMMQRIRPITGAFAGFVAGCTHWTCLHPPSTSSMGKTFFIRKLCTRAGSVDKPASVHHYVHCEQVELSHPSLVPYLYTYVGHAFHVSMEEQPAYLLPHQHPRYEYLHTRQPRQQLKRQLQQQRQEQQQQQQPQQQQQLPPVAAADTAAVAPTATAATAATAAAALCTCALTHP